MMELLIIKRHGKLSPNNTIILLTLLFKTMKLVTIPPD